MAVEFLEPKAYQKIEKENKYVLQNLCLCSLLKGEFSSKDFGRF